jgi:hypothetical protein
MTHLEANHIKILHNAGIIEKIATPRGEVQHFGYIFLHEETLKTRYRIVHDALSVNCLLNPTTPSFQPIEQVRNAVAKLKVSHLLTIDLKAYFYQFALHESVRRFFTIRTLEAWYQLCRLPMGVNFAPTIAQLVLMHLCNRANIGRLYYDAYIDNLLVAGSESQLRHFLARFQSLCDDFGVTIGASCISAHSVTHRGITFHPSENTFHIARDFVTKFQLKLHRHQDWLTHRHSFQRVMGSIVYFYCANSIPLAQLYPLLRRLAEAARTSRLSVPSQAVTSAAREAVSLVTQLAPRALVMTSGNAVTIITDASTSKWRVGMILVAENGNVKHASVTAPSHLNDINEMEAWALLAALHHFKESIQGRSIHVVGDNTAALFSIHATFAKSYFLNGIVRDILQVALRFGVALSCFYVPSRHNPADQISRGATFSPKDATDSRAIARDATRGVVAVVAPIAGERAKEYFQPQRTNNTVCQLCQ